MKWLIGLMLGFQLNIAQAKVFKAASPKEIAKHFQCPTDYYDTVVEKGFFAAVPKRAKVVLMSSHGTRRWFRR